MSGFINDAEVSREADKLLGELDELRAENGKLRELISKMLSSFEGYIEEDRWMEPDLRGDIEHDFALFRREACNGFGVVMEHK